ncbi:hypothetical protein HYPSUDRAFT_168399 [Hypholoma sublateritium FD-334 SS-4]|uniref:Uncharacterized protein n=1 Tax=Hypholoma sublateritium (strain FD-334 SS-4) TaxID=945553 RepID=A0A0D2M7N4_HYPSF|nr:hypothetical protein HYPSUDRAFT_168399 [Hypholoma sublateritium FD-334 SS-4]
MASSDCTERPFKRQKLDIQNAKTLPPDVLLLSLPHLIAHPPTHKYHTRSLLVTLFALRKCLSVPNLDILVECRAWTELAEVGLRIGMDQPGIESEVSKAISKALMIANKHPSLRVYKPQLTHLSARLASYQKNTKQAQNSLKKVITNFLLPSDPPQVTYTAHLAYINSHFATSHNHDPPTYSAASPSLKSLGAIRDLHDLAIQNQHPQIAQLAMVLELRDLVQYGAWTRVGESLKSIERQLNLIFEGNPTKQISAQPAFPAERTKLETVLIVHVLIIGVLYHTYAGDSTRGHVRLKQLHELLDGGALDAFGTSGIVDVNLPRSPLFRVQVTHPRVIFTLGFLISSISKRDPVGRKPKRRMFANEGMLVVDKELKKEIPLPSWGSLADVENFQLRMYKMKADMMCELIGLCISRSEFTDAERHLAQVIAHTRTYNLFTIYSARITLHQAHLAHSLGQADRALKCYQIAAFISRRQETDDIGQHSADNEDSGCEDYWVNVSARIGEIWLRVGLAGEETDEDSFERAMKPLRRKGEKVAKECEGLGGTLRAVGAVLSAMLSKEFLVTKAQLRIALNLSTSAQDNHLRALVLALVAAQYVHTSTEHAETMLGTAEQLAAGLGAQPKAPPKADTSKVTPTLTERDGVGNAHLRLWIGERNLELKRRSADERGASKQIAANEKFMAAVVRVQKRKFLEVE